MITLRATLGGCDSAGKLLEVLSLAAVSRMSDRRTLRRGDVGGKGAKCGTGTSTTALGAWSRYSDPAR
jgi:hypothetical protein